MKRKHSAADEAARRRQIVLPPDDYQDRGPTTKPMQVYIEPQREQAQFQFRQVEVPAGRDDQAKVLNRYAAEGWELQSIRSGGWFRKTDLALLRRRVS